MRLARRSALPARRVWSDRRRRRRFPARLPRRGSHDASRSRAAPARKRTRARPPFQRGVSLRARGAGDPAELCDEAIRLATLLAEHPVGAVPETHALLALMHLHSARLGARLDATGGLLLLEEQDRSLWDLERMRFGAEWLEQAAAGEVFSRFHAEAGIAAEHCFAPSFGETRWSEISDLYAMLERIDPSPLHT